MSFTQYPLTRRTNGEDIKRAPAINTPVPTKQISANSEIFNSLLIPCCGFLKCQKLRCQEHTQC